MDPALEQWSREPRTANQSLSLSADIQEHHQVK